MIKENFEKILINHFLQHEEESILLLLKNKANKILFKKINKDNMYLSFAIDLNLNKVVKQIIIDFPLNAIDQNKFLIKSYKKNNMPAFKLLLNNWHSDDLQYSFIREMLSQKFIQNEEEIIKRIINIKMDNKRIEYWLDYIELKLNEKQYSNLNSSMISYYKQNSLKWSDALVQKLKMNCNETLQINLKSKEGKPKLKI